MMKAMQCMRFSTKVGMDVPQFKNVTVIGGGLMGSGIAQVAAQYGQNVSLIEINDETLSKSRKIITKSVENLSKKMYKEKPNDASLHSKSILERINYATDITKSVHNADVVIEAIVENLEIKHKVFKTVEQAVSENTLLCTNTSSISVTKIGSILKNPERFGAVHFFNPLPTMKLVEIVRTEKTSQKTSESLVSWAKSIGRIPVMCKDTPGFIVNRLLFPLVSEAIRMYERGDADKEDIDKAMKLGANHPIGPIELSDLVGHDTIIEICKSFRESDPTNNLFDPLESQKRLYETGKLGIKSGEGYYKYPKANN